MEYRARFESSKALEFQSGNDDAFLLSRTRLNVGIKPTEKARFFVQGQDARVSRLDLGRSQNGLKNTFDLRQGYLALGDEQNGWWTLTAGRQLLAFGDERLIGTDEWSNVQRSFDAVNFGLQGGENRVNVFAASVVEVDMNNFDKRRDGNNLYGAYGDVRSVLPNTVLEPYFLFRSRPLVVDERGGLGDADVYTSGIRLYGKTRRGFTYEMDVARQFGKYGRDDTSAWVGTWVIGVAPPAAALRPYLSAEYNYASGDSTPGDGQRGTFDQLYPSNHRHYGIADLVGRRNMQNVRFGLNLHPTRAISFRFDHHAFWLASRYDALYRADGTVSVPAVPGGAKTKHVGNEWDLQLAFAVSDYITFGGGVALFDYGSFLRETGNGTTRTFSYVFVRFGI